MQTTSIQFVSNLGSPAMSADLNDFVASLVRDSSSHSPGSKDEEICIGLLARIRWPQGFTCGACKCNQHYAIRSRGLRQCARCRAQFSVTAGTFMDSTRVPVSKWFRAIDLLMNHGRLTVHQFASLLLLRYKTAWLLKYKIEQALKNDGDRIMVMRIAEIMRAYTAGSRSGV